MNFKELLGVFGVRPKNLESASTAQDAAKEFAEKVGGIFAEAEIDLDTMLAAGPSGLKDYIEAKVAEARAGAAEEVATHKAAAEASANAANGLKAKLEAASKDLESVHSALSASGIEVDSKKPLNETLPAAVKSRISIKAGELLAATGGPLLNDKPSDALKPENENNGKELTGRARVIASFKPRK